MGGIRWTARKVKAAVAEHVRRAEQGRGGTGCLMGGLPREARDGIMRVWLEILSKKHPGVSWVPVERQDLGKAAAGMSSQSRGR